MNDLINSLKTIIHQQFDVDPQSIDPDAPFAAYNLDSLTVTELLFAIEDHFQMEVPDDAVGTVTNLRELATLMEKLRPAGAA